MTKGLAPHKKVQTLLNGVTQGFRNENVTLRGTTEFVKNTIERRKNVYSRLIQLRPPPPVEVKKNFC